MISKDDFLNAESLKQFKVSKDFSSFMEELYVRGTEKKLEAEMDQHLGYEKHAPRGRNGGNSRNGKTSKKLMSKYGPVEIEVPRDRESSFERVLVPKRRSLAEGIEELVVSLYNKNMSTRDIEEQLRELYQFNLSESTISNSLPRSVKTSWNGSKGRCKPFTTLFGWMVSSSKSAITAK